MLPHVSLDALRTDLDAALLALRRDDSAITSSRERIREALGDGQSYYGLNTGFGAMARVRIDPDQLVTLQKNLVVSHAVGVGEPIPQEISRLMLEFKILSLGQGYSGISKPTFDGLIDLLDHDIIPVIPSRGSVGASGDLAPLAHLALPLIGMGAVWGDDGRPRPASDALTDAGLRPVELGPKDGLALINGTQMMTAYGAHVLSRAKDLVKLADVLGAMALEVIMGSASPFDERVHRLRPHPGQVAVAANVRRLLEGSEILESHRNCDRVQDPYSIRCIPQVHGASRDALAYASTAIEIEINSVTDNPLVFEDGEIVSAGNFHGQPLAIALDTAAIALAELASISERRQYLMLEGNDDLPRLLMQDTGINSGFMIAQYTSAALVSENKGLCHPAAVDSIPTSLGQEDHVSMGSISGLKLLSVLGNVEQVLANELCLSAQGLDFRNPLKPGPGLRAAHDFIRSRIKHVERDEWFKPIFDEALNLLQDPGLIEAIESAAGPLT